MTTERPKPANFVDSLISSIGSLYIAITSLMIIFIYASLTLFFHNQSLTKLADLDKLLALRYFASASRLPSRQASLLDLPRFYTQAGDEYFDELAKSVEDDDASQNDDASQKMKSKFTDESIENTYVYRSVPMRMAVGAACDVLGSKLRPGKEFGIVSNWTFGATYQVKSENVELLSFYHCGLGPHGEFKVLKFSIGDGQFVFAVPSSLERQFGPATPIGFFDFPFTEFEEVRSNLPEPLSQYVSFDEKYIVLHAKAIDAFISDYARYLLGKYFPADRLEDAARQMYEEKEREASYLGVTAASSLLVKLGPLIYFVLSFELWRRVRRLPDGKLKSDRYWFAFETGDFFGRINSYVQAAMPLLFGILMYGLFAISQSLALIVFGHVISIPGIFAWTFPPSPGFRWMSFDLFPFFILVLVPIHFVILWLITRKLLRVVRTNVQAR